MEYVYWLVELWDLLYGWVRYMVPMPWLTFIHSALAFYVGYLLGQFVLARRLNGNGYSVQVWTDRRGERRYFVDGDGLEIEEDDDESYE